MSSAEGLGFSIPINTAKPIIEQIIRDGSFSTVYVGITGIDVETYEMGYGIDSVSYTHLLYGILY